MTGSTDGNGNTLVVAYDRGGRVLGTAGGNQNDCFADPGGRVMIRGAGADTNCTPAIPWR